MFLEIVTPDKIIFEGEVRSVKLPGSKGSFQLLKNHAPIISTLEKGTLKVVDENKKEHSFFVESGVVENKKNKIIVLLEKI
ncbi:MAG: ATP synthase F1 subunit epsilon [Tangfeifania sp.]